MKFIYKGLIIWNKNFILKIEFIYK